MSKDYQDLSTQTRPYTVGVSIAVFLIFLIALIHVWKFLVKKIKKCLNSNQLETVITEVPPSHHEGRKISSSCVHQLEMVLKYDDEVAGINVFHTQSRMCKRSLSENLGRLERKRSVKRKRNSISNQKVRESSDQESHISRATFFAGYSHRHINDA